MSKPVLSSYPYLYSILRNDPRANTDFNAILSALNSPSAAAAREQELIDSLEAERTLRTEIQTAANKNSEVTKKTVRFIKLLGEVMEPQVKLQPYAQDVSTKATYDIKFSASQVRMALRLYWDVLSSRMEEILGGDEVRDPADEVEES